MRTRLSSASWGVALTVLLFAPLSAWAQAPEPDAIPPALRPWVPWVLADQPTYGCTSAESSAGGSSDADPICVWPSALRVEIHEGGATFAMDVTADRAYALTLPGSGRVWPLDVRVDTHAAPVLARSDRAIVMLAAGAHRVEGRFSWTTAPDTLDVPADVARVIVVQSGVTRVATRDADGAVWVHAAADEQAEVAEADSVNLEVWRQVADGVPLSLTTRIAVHVAGHPRELRLGDVLPAGAVPIEVVADLATRVTADGELTLQIHAGTYSVMVRALLASPDAALAPPHLAPPWPEQEVWTWAPNEAFRQVEVGGASSIDPARTTLPDDWRSFSAYLVEGGATLTLTSLRRGEPTPPPNTLSLSREIWLDQEGSGASVRDALNLQMHDAFRIDLEAGVLGRVEIDGHDQLITHATDESPVGVELRNTSSSVTAEWRLEEPLAEIAAVGWSEDAQSVSTTLNVPPGWVLLHASGVDRANGSWTDLWTLLGFFALLLITVVVGRVYGAAWGAVAFVGVGLAYHAPDAPQWIWVALAVTLALHRALGARAIARWTQRLYVVLSIAACTITVLFAAQETRLALHPSLDPEGGGAVGGGGGGFYEPTPPDEAEEGGGGWRHRDDEGAMGERSHAATSVRYGIEGPSDEPIAASDARSSAYGWMDPSSVVQTGFGCPTWTWRSYTLDFDGPVGRDHHLRVWLAPPWMTSLMGLLRAALALALCFIAIRSRPTSAGATPSAVAPAAAASAALLLLACLAAPSVVAAQASAPIGPIPSPELLTELATRLTQAPSCGDTCAEASYMHISAHGDVLAIDINLGVTAQAAYPLPGPIDTWSADTITLDGQPAHSLVRLSRGFVHVRVTPGMHAVHIEGSLAGHDAITLALGRAPRMIEIATEGWESDGSGTGPHVPESIQLRRSMPSTPVDATDAADATVHAVLPSWLEVERRLEIGVRWTIRSTLTRLSPPNAADVVHIPLLVGESVTDPNVVVDGQTAIVTLAQHDSSIVWTSTLEPLPEVVLHARETGRVSETWTVACTPLWHCATRGVNPTSSASGVAWEPHFDPWPGESLTIALTRPGAAPGQSTTIDSASLEFHPGARLSSSQLTMHARTSVSAPLSIALPADADIRTLTVDGQSRPIQRTDGTLTVTLQPGAHNVEVDWQEADGWTSVLHTPRVTLGTAAVNLALDVGVTSDRWLLWIAGPRWGPAVLIWPYAVVILVVAFALSRRRELLPKLRDWILLGLGLTQVPWALALFIVGWFFVVEWRRSTPLGPIAFDSRQLFVAAYTFFAAFALIGVISDGLLGTPGMDVEGPGTWPTNLHFFVDRTSGAMPDATIITLPVFVFRVLMFLWAGWLALAVVRWARRGWTIFADGGLWQSLPAAHRAPAPASAPRRTNTVVVEADPASPAGADEGATPPAGGAKEP